MHPVLLQSKSLTIERPQRPPGTLLLVLLGLTAVALSIALAVKASDWLLAADPAREAVSWPTFLACLGAILLLLLAVMFAFWAYASYSIRYFLDSSGLGIRWGPLRQFIPIDHIEKVTLGRGEQQPRVGGLSWWGHHIGPGVAEGVGDVLFFSTHRSPEDVIYVHTSTATYGLSPLDGMRFAQEVKRYQESGRAGGGEVVQRHPIAAHPLWTDRIAQGLALMVALLNVALFGYIFAIYPGLSDQITIAFPPIGGVSALDSKRELLKIPATALALSAVNLIVAFGFHRRERVITYLLLSGGVFLQLLFWIAVAIAVSNA